MAPEQVLAMLEATGGSAFPSEQTVEGGGTLTMSGMTLRDYFAAQALALLANRSWEHLSLTSEQLIQQWALSSYAIADAMLAERRK